MIRQFRVFSNQQGAQLNSASWRGLLFLGLSLIGFALLILSMPELLIYLISGGIMMLGFTIVGTALSIKKLSKNESFGSGKTTILD